MDQIKSFEVYNGTAAFKAENNYESTSILGDKENIPRTGMGMKRKSHKGLGKPGSAKGSVNASK